jgi:para-nitrobenzyl esterase
MRRKRGLRLSVALAIACAGLAVPLSAATYPTLVQIDSGAVRGVAAGGVISFKGIPFATPPVGQLRWRAPQPVEPWEGTLQAAAFGPACMQTDDVPKSEDCLTLNVWRPAAASDGPLPVMVWIYGGALAHGGAAIYPGDALAAQGAVVVSMNYRVGRLGFFAHPALAREAPDEPRGNYGYLDQLAALHWVQRNIAAFGGDPEKVTIFGESAGGGSVMAHMVSPLSRGLFHGAILQSPGIPTARAKVLPLTALDDAEQRAVAYARSVGIEGDGAEALAALRALPAEKLVEGASAPEVLAGLSSGQPVVGVSGSILDGRFLIEPPEAAFAAARQAMVPVIVGANSRDLGIGMAETKDDLFALFGDHANGARSLYDPKGDETLDELRQQVLADMTLVEPSRHLADETARAGQPIWWYRFSYVAESQRDKFPGTLHGFEIPYAFNIPAAIVGDEMTEADKAIGALASAYWVAFGKTGDPNGGGRPEWPRHDPAVDRVIDFTNAGVVVGPDPLKARLDLWQKVMDENQ